jgi:hypothetical protein
MLLAERFILLVLDPHTGELHAPQAKADLDALCAAGLLIELVAQQRLHADHGALRASSDLPASHPLLDEAHGALAAQRLDARHAIATVARLHAPLPKALCESLYRRDFLHRQRDARFWRRQRLRYPLRSIQARNQAEAELHAVAAGARERLLQWGLWFLVDMAGLLARHLPAAEYEKAVAQLLELGQAQSQPERQALALLRSALVDI